MYPGFAAKSDPWLPRHLLPMGLGAEQSGGARNLSKAAAYWFGSRQLPARLLGLAVRSGPSRAEEREHKNNI